MRQSFARNPWKSARVAACKPGNAPEKAWKNFSKKIKLHAVSFATDSTNNIGRQVSICAALRTIHRVLLKMPWNELDYRLTHAV
ncbi:hypothetical protein TNCV_5108921 [Trichonephila clavipes]|nr:hypothetical protein TNCV_5108921 [Trichonephila clavipes]